MNVIPAACPPKRTRVGGRRGSLVGTIINVLGNILKSCKVKSQKHHFWLSLNVFSVKVGFYAKYILLIQLGIVVLNLKIW